MTKVLIADDEPNIVVSLEFMMKREGYDVLVARDGTVALATIRASRPALVLLDGMMPGMSGFEVCEAVRADPDFAGIRIVMLVLVMIGGLVGIFIAGIFAFAFVALVRMLILRSGAGSRQCRGGITGQGEQQNCRQYMNTGGEARLMHGRSSWIAGVESPPMCVGTRQGSPFGHRTGPSRGPAVGVRMTSGAVGGWRAQG